MNRSNTILTIGAALFTAFLFWQLPRALPLIDWGNDAIDYHAKISEIREHLGVYEVWEISAMKRFEGGLVADRLRKSIGDQMVNRMIGDGRLIYSEVRTSDNAVFRFDPEGDLVSMSMPGKHGAPMDIDQRRAAIAGFVSKFYPDRPDVELTPEGAAAMYRKSDYPNVLEHIRFTFSGERLTWFYVDYRREFGDAPAAGLSRFAPYLSGAAYIILLMLSLGCFARFLFRLKSEPESPVGVLMMVSLFLGVLSVGSFAGQDQFPFLVEVPIHAIFPFLILGMLGYGWTLDRRINNGAGMGDFVSAFQGKLSPKSYGRQLLIGLLLCPWSLGVFALTLALLDLVTPMIVQPQPTDFFKFMLQSPQPAAAGASYFSLIAVLEESAYRLCAALIILRLTKRKWLAILIPSILYACAHSDLPFLPPQHPFAFKLLSSIALGCVWGFAYFRFGFLAVVIAHYFCDLTLVFYFFQSESSSFPLGLVVVLGLLGTPMFVRIIPRLTK